jgi:hypothetical protein
MSPPSQTHGFLRELRDKSSVDGITSCVSISRREFIGLGTAWVLVSSLFAPSASYAGLLPSVLIRPSGEDHHRPIGSSELLFRA